MSEEAVAIGQVTSSGVLDRPGVGGMIVNVVSEFWAILVEAGPWLLAGFLVAGVLHVALPKVWVAKRFGSRGGGLWSRIKPIIGATLVGAPLPLCSCSVIPAAAQFRRSGASKGSSAAFAIATPEVDVPAASLTWAMLGWPITLARVAGALASGFVAGLAVDALDRSKPAEPSATETPTGCEADPGAVSCCCHNEDPPPTTPSLATKTTRALRYAFWTLPKDLGGWMAIGLLLAAAIAAFLPADALEQVGTGWPAMLLMLVIGVPFYVCAASSTPLAAVLVAKGLDPGAAVVFLLAGPATNPATMAWVVKDLGGRSLAPYLGSIAVVALGMGAAVNALVPAEALSLGAVTDHAHHAHAGILTQAAGVALAVVLGAPLVVGTLRGIIRRSSPSTAAHDCCATHDSEPVALGISARREPEG